MAEECSAMPQPNKQTKSSHHTPPTEHPVDDEQRAWYRRKGLTRYAAPGDEGGDVTEDERPPVVALGPHDDDFIWAPAPQAQGYPGKSLRDMNLDDYNSFIYRWLEAAVRAGDVRCAHCGRLILDDY